VSDVVALAEAQDVSLFGSKAVGLGQAVRDGLPVPPGVALSGAIVDAVASGDKEAIEKVALAVRPLGGPLAVRSSAVDEDGADASFAGQHLTLLNVPSWEELTAAVSEIWWSANSDSAITYRQRVGLFTRPSVGVVVQLLLDPDAAGVMFTQNPVTGADERVIEASFGLGEAVVAGLVIPDSFRIDRSGEVLERTPGLKKIAVRSQPNGGTVEEQVPRELAEKLCLDDSQLAQLNRLADRCEHVYGRARDIEWAVADGTLYLLQCRAVTRAGPERPAAGAPVAALKRVPLFADLDDNELGEIGRLFKARRFPAGETVIQEGSGGAAFFVIDSGEATVVVGGEERATLTAGEHFGEIALIDEGTRTATVTAASELICYGLTFWDFRPLVERNGVIGWKLLQSMAKMYRDARQR
jgi:phosphoenolpyruvate synthase/pyruvate phosphate dikinase